jgi:toxin ParE1/3/4
LFDESPLRAQAILDRVIGRADSLDRSPERGRRLRELRSIGDKTWREVQEPPWRIIYYRVVGDTVEVHGVLDARRNLEDLLLERLLDA